MEYFLFDGKLENMEWKIKNMEWKSKKHGI